MKRFEEINSIRVLILMQLKSNEDRIAFNGVRKLLVLLSREEIPLLKLLIGEFDYIIKKPGNNLSKELIAQIKIIKKGIWIFLKKSEKELAKAKEILERITFLDEKDNSDFYQIHPKDDNNLKKLLNKLIVFLESTLKLETKLKVKETDKILKGRNMSRRLFLARAAACFATAYIIGCQKAPEPTEIDYKCQMEDNATRIYQKSKYPYLGYKSFLIEFQSLNPQININKLTIGDKYKIPYEKGMTEQKPNPYCHDSDNFRDEPEKITFMRALFGECEGQNITAKNIVAAVIIYRLWSPSFPNNLHDVLLNGRSFPCLIKGDKQFLKKVKDPLTYNPRDWLLCKEVVERVFNENFNFMLKENIPLVYHYRDFSVKELNEPYIRVNMDNIPFHLYVARNDKITTNFKINEFTTPNCKSITIYLELVLQLEKLRKIAEEIEGGRTVKIVGVNATGTTVTVDAVNVVIRKKGEKISIKDMTTIAENAGLSMIEGTIHLQVNEKRGLKYLNYVNSDIDPKTGKPRIEKPEQTTASKPEQTTASKPEQTTATQTGMLSEHFSVREFTCKCHKCEIPQIDPKLIEKLEELRTLSGNKKITVHSGFRCEKYNKKVGGSPKSQHLLGKAADITISGLDVDQISALAEKIGFQGIGKYPNQHFVHVDTRIGKKSIWTL